MRRSATHDFLLVIRATTGLSCTFSEINGDFGRNGKFSHPHVAYLTPQLSEFLLEFCNCDSAQKLVMPL